MVHLKLKQNSEAVQKECTITASTTVKRLSSSQVVLIWNALDHQQVWSPRPSYIVSRPQSYRKSVWGTEALSCQATAEKPKPLIRVGQNLS